MRDELLALTLDELGGRHPTIAAFLSEADPAGGRSSRTLAVWLGELGSETLDVLVMDRGQILSHVEALAWRAGAPTPADAAVRSLTVLGGRDKRGRDEGFDLHIEAGEVVCVVGPTGSGKSRLLADIECLAQGDTPSGRRVLIDGREPDPDSRYSANRKLVAQVSQNMNFVVDLTVADFVAMHAQCRDVAAPAEVVRDVIDCANDLAGERFSDDVSVTQLSGGQTRALMIADTALLSASPIMLIDEIENAGIDHKRALALLVAKEKIAVISTHDPLLALIGGRRVAVCNGAIAAVIEASAVEQANLAALERIDRAIDELRQRLRVGERIEALPELLAGRG